MTERRQVYRDKPWRTEIWLIAALVLILAGGGIWQLANLVSDIQTSREEITRENCESQNARHDASIAALDQVIARAVQENPDQRERIERSRQSTVFLIDALVPVQDCEARVEKVSVDD